MSLEEAITFLEATLEADLEAMSEKDRTQFLINLWEFKTPKLQRSTFLPTASKAEKSVTINIVNGDPSD